MNMDFRSLYQNKLLVEVRGHCQKILKMNENFIPEQTGLLTCRNRTPYIEHTLVLRAWFRTHMVADGTEPLDALKDGSRQSSIRVVPIAARSCPLYKRRCAQCMSKIKKAAILSIHLK